MDYFDDVIGVTKPENAEIQVVKLKFSENRINYVLTKLLRGTQKPDKTDNSGSTIQIEVIPNRELYQLILSFGEDVEVISPPEIRQMIKEKIIEMNNKY